MSYNYGMRDKTSQQQAIVRQREREDQIRKEQDEKAEKEKLVDDIISLLNKEKTALSHNEIADRLGIVSAKVLSAINSTSHEIIKRELENNGIVYEVKKES